PWPRECLPPPKSRPVNWHLPLHGLTPAVPLASNQLRKFANRVDWEQRPCEFCALLPSGPEYFASSGPLKTSAPSQLRFANNGCESCHRHELPSTTRRYKWIVTWQFAGRPRSY